DNLVQSVNGNNEETNYLKSKLVYYLERYDIILNPDVCKTVIKYDNGDEDESVTGSNGRFIRNEHNQINDPGSLGHKSDLVAEIGAAYIPQK
ncbi:27260_t:CDS:2, partial [Racocetra persica]